MTEAGFKVKHNNGWNFGVCHAVTPTTGRCLSADCASSNLFAYSRQSQKQTKPAAIIATQEFSSITSKRKEDEAPSSFRCQAVTPNIRCSSSDCVSKHKLLADSRQNETLEVSLKTSYLEKERTKGKSTRRLEHLRKKRLRRNWKKRQAIRKLSKPETNEKHSQKLKAEIDSLKREFSNLMESNRKDKSLLAFSWKSWQEEKKKKTKIAR